MTDAFLIVARFMHYLALLFLFGVCLFPAYALWGDERQTYWRKSAGRLRADAFVALASGLFWLLFTAAAMTDSLSRAIQWQTIEAALTETGFGLVWSVHLGLIAAFAVLAALDCGVSVAGRIVLTALSAAALASIAGAGHTQMPEGAAFVFSAESDGAHLLAAGAWLGGLVPLFAVLSRPHSDSGGRYEDRVLLRFSSMAIGAVAVLIATGIVNTLFSLNSFSDMFTSLYGRLLTVKLVLFALMLLLAASNRFLLLPRLLAEDTGQNREVFLLSLRKRVGWEVAFGLLVIAIVSALGTLPPEGN